MLVHDVLVSEFPVESRCEDTLMLTMLYTLLFKGNCFVLCLACDCAFCLKDGGRCIGLYDRRWDIRSTALLVFTNCHRGNGFYDSEAWSLPSKAMDEAISVSVMKVELLHCVVAFTDLIYIPRSPCSLTDIIDKISTDKSKKAWLTVLGFLGFVFVLLLFGGIAQGSSSEQGDTVELSESLVAK